MCVRCDNVITVERSRGLGYVHVRVYTYTQKMMIVQHVPVKFDLFAGACTCNERAVQDGEIPTLPRCDPHIRHFFAGLLARKTVAISSSTDVE